jgi:hypothetical protein
VSKMKNLSRAGWAIVGLVAAMLLIPTMAVAATVTYNGIEGTNGTTTTLNKADVSSAGQLLTTPAQPSKYEDFYGPLDSYGTTQCKTVDTIPSGESFIAEQVEVDAFQLSSPGTYTSPAGVYSNSNFTVYADPPAYGGGCDQYFMTSGVAPGGTVGNVVIPIVPGYVVPSGYYIDVYSQGLDAEVYITGYLVPSADAPIVTNIARRPTNIAGLRLRLSHR